MNYGANLSKLYSDQLDPDDVNVCDWCLDLEAKQKQKIQSRKRKAELQEMESRKVKEIIASICKSKKGNSKPTLNHHAKFGEMEKKRS